MYTQCPHCDTAFRVTAEVLKQAAGQVRCGGCGNAFNALEYLSEDKPQKTAKPEPEAPVPELKPDSSDEKLEQVSVPKAPKTMSATQSAALLKTLDDLAGSDVRIEDTGVEWRVFDDEEESDEPDPVNDTGSMKWFLEDDFPEDSDAERGAMADVFEEPGVAVVDELLEETPTPVDQFLTDTPNDVEAEEIFVGDDEERAGEPQKARTSVDELRFDDNTPLPDDFDFDDEPPPRLDIEEPAHATEPEVIELHAAEEVHVDLAFGDVDDWEALLDEVEVAPAKQIEEPEEPEERAEAEAEAEADSKTESPPDIDTQFEIQAEAMGIDLSGIHEGATRIEDAEPEELEAEQAEVKDPEVEEIQSPIEALEEDLAEAEAAIERSTSDEYKTLDLDAFEGELEIDFEDEADELELETEAELEAEPDSDEIEPGIPEDREPEPAEPEEDEHVVLPPTEEEQTINIQIDQDLMALAIEDEDGFASTIVKGSIEEIIEEEKRPEKATLTAEDFDSPAVETIIMEGEYVMSELERQRREAEAVEAVDLAELGIRPDTREAEETKIRGGRRKTDPPSWGKIAAALALGLLLALQVLHQSRDMLATIPAFNKAVGPLYRLIGQPLQPSWDISGWRFEATRGNADETNETLTIFSRLGNKSGQSLPYPLISVALTDRFEEVIGNKVLEPNEYLADDLDPRKPVAPGNTFNAMISIKTPSADATGYKLNVCYRIEGGQLRCAIEDFR